VEEMEIWRDRHIGRLAGRRRPTADQLADDAIRAAVFVVVIMERGMWSEGKGVART